MCIRDRYQDALKKGYHLVLNSGYRSYESQMEIYEEYFRKYDKITASKLVSKPGSSEHQLGLGVDLTSQSVVEMCIRDSLSLCQWQLLT